jgi:beta-lactamase regulating signal transducer with metallopeptidase domain
MLAWMGYAMLAAAVLGVAARLIDFAVAGRSGRRRVLWAGVFLASAAGPIVFSVTRGLSTAVVAEDGIGAASVASGRKGPIVSDRVLGSAWLAASALFALGLVATQRRLRRRLGVCPSRVVDGERVLVSPDFGPAVVGVVRPQIVLPEWALAMHESDRRIIVAHETEHRQAHDPLLAAVALIVVVALPWNAALWWQLRRLRLAIEIDCDRRVVSRHSHDPHTYLRLLLATRTSRVTPPMAMAMAAMRSALGRRVEALVDGRPRSVVRRLSALAAAVVLAAGIVSVPAPRLSIGRAAVDDASAAVSPMLPRPALTLARFDSSQTRIIAPVTPPAVAPPRHEQTGSREGRGYGRSDSAPMVGGRRDTVPTAAPSGWIVVPGAVRNGRILVRNAAGNRGMLLPISDPAGIVSVPSPRPTLVPATVAGASAAEAPLASSTTPALPTPPNRRIVVPGAAQDGRILVRNAAGNRMVLLPISDSPPPSPP